MKIKKSWFILSLVGLGIGAVLLGIGALLGGSNAVSFLF